MSAVRLAFVVVLGLSTSACGVTSAYFQNLHTMPAVHRQGDVQASVWRGREDTDASVPVAVSDRTLAIASWLYADRYDARLIKQLNFKEIAMGRRGARKDGGALGWWAALGGVGVGSVEAMERSSDVCFVTCFWAPRVAGRYKRVFFQYTAGGRKGPLGLGASARVSRVSFSRYSEWGRDDATGDVTVPLTPFGSLTGHFLEPAISALLHAGPVSVGAQYAFSVDLSSGAAFRSGGRKNAFGISVAPRR